jgi:hypothetical protein
MKKVFIFLSIVGLSIVLVRCGGSSSTSSSASAYSSAGTISSPFSVTTSTTQVDLNNRLIPSKYTDVKKKIDDMLAVSSGLVSDCQKLFVIDFSKFSSANANCYGPQVTLGGNHPDSGTATNAVLPTGDLGIWDATDTSGTACAAAQVNSLTDYAASSPFYAQLLAAYAYCYVANGGTLSMPTGTATTTFVAADLAAFGFTSGKDTLSVTDVSITSITNTAGDSGFRFDLTGSMTDGDTSPTKTYTFHVISQYAKSSAGAQSGTASYAMTDSAGGGGNCTPGGGVVLAGMETFNLNAAGTNNTVMLRHGEFCGKTASPLSATTYDIDFSNKLSGSTPTGWGNSGTYLLFSFDPTTLDGSYVYAWQAGPNDGHTRVFNATISTASGAQTGMAYVGFGSDVATAADLGSLKGMICNWAGPSADPAKPYVPTAAVSVQSQAMAKDATTGKWTPTANHIRFAPVKECSFTSGSFTLTYNSTSGTMSNDSTTLAASRGSKDLTLLTDVTFTAPTAPTF